MTARRPAYSIPTAWPCCDHCGQPRPCATAPHRQPCACQVAGYFKKAKPRSKVLILDANPEVISKKGLFTKAWSDLYKGIVEYRNNSEVKDVEVGTNTAVLEFDKFKADVLNVVPPQRAGQRRRGARPRTTGWRWC